MYGTAQATSRGRSTTSRPRISRAGYLAICSGASCCPRISSILRRFLQGARIIHERSETALCAAKAPPGRRFGSRVPRNAFFQKRCICVKRRVVGRPGRIYKDNRASHSAGPHSSSGRGNAFSQNRRICAEHRRRSKETITGPHSEADPRCFANDIRVAKARPPRRPPLPPTRSDELRPISTTSATSRITRRSREATRLASFKTQRTRDAMKPTANKFNSASAMQSSPGRSFDRCTSTSWRRV